MSITEQELKALISKKFEEIEASMKFINDKYEAVLSRLTKIEKENESLKLENNAIKGQLQTALSKIKDQEIILDELEQYQRRDCVEITGIPTSDDEDTNDIVLNVADLLDVNIEESDISISHRLQANTKFWTDANGLKHPPSPPAIIAKFVRRDVKERFYNARNRLKGKSTLDLECLNDDDRSVGNNIYISESLTSPRKKLYKSCLKVKKDFNFRFISTMNGRIFLKKARGSRSFEVKCEADLARLRLINT